MYLPPPPLQGSQYHQIPACTLQRTNPHRVGHSPEDNQSIPIEKSSCNLQFFSELIITQLRISHDVTVNSLYSLVSCLWGCGESVNPPKSNIQEFQGALCSTVCPEKSVTLTISENIPKPQNKFWVLCSNAWHNLHQTHMCLGQGLVLCAIEKVPQFISSFWYIFRNS